MNWQGFLFISIILAAQGLFADDLAEAVKASGVQGGIVVRLGCDDGEDLASMRLNDRFTVQALDVDAAKVAAVRSLLQTKRQYGSVSAVVFNGKSLPYADNTINLFMADDLGKLPESEVLRALAPLGKMVVGGRTTTKPWPDVIDDWPQYLNKADNNAVAMDSVAGPPRFVQWIDHPTWCRSHMGIPTVANLVTGNGRLFAIEDTSPPDNPFLPSAFRIVARDAFNGKELWSRPITQWESVTTYIKCQPAQQQRRMAVVGDVLYCTLQLEGPVSALDAATGETLRTYESLSPVQEIAYDQGTLFLNVGDRFSSAAYNIVKTKNKPFVEGVDPDGPFFGASFRRGYAPEIKDKENPVSRIAALDSQTGQRRWTTGDIANYTGCSLAVQGDYAVYQASNGLFCISSQTGEEIWRQEKPISNAVGHDSLTPGTVPNTVVIAAGKVFAVEGPQHRRVESYPDNTVYAYDLASGDLLWQAPARGNYEASSDVFFVNGSLWIGGEHPKQYDPDTGELIKTIVQKMTGPMGHDRCYRNYITERYYINSKTGGADFLDLESSLEIPQHWTRGGCGSGVLPANGLIYSTPYSCQCSMGAMFQGMHAYASVPSRMTASNQPMPVKRSSRLEKGPAFGNVPSAGPRAEDEWPTYRHDSFRSGISDAPAPKKLNTRWTTKLAGKPSAVTCAAGKVYVCQIDSHAVVALNAESGETEWTYTADARVDSPPTCYKGTILFGSRGGWVYCLRASDGELVWRFKDLPDRLIGAYGQLESAWPVFGSVLIVKDRLYFAAGRTSFLDGGVFLYALEPGTGKVLKSRSVYGPFTEENGFPVGGDAGFQNDVVVSDGDKIYLRHRAFDLDLNDAQPGVHIIPSGGFLDGQPQHRTSWALGSGIARNNVGDILVSRGETYYEVWGFPLWANHSYFDPRRNGYTLFARTRAATAQPAASAAKRTAGAKRKKASGSGRGAAGRELWQQSIPITGKAMALAGEVLLIAGEPMTFDDDSYETYVAAYRGDLGGRLLAVSPQDGATLAEYKLDAAPVWDSLAVADGRVYISLQDGTVQCFGE